MTKFAEALTSLLEQKGLTKSELSRALSLPEQTVRNWFGRESLPAVDVAVKVAKFFNVSAEYLVDGEENCEKSVRREPSALEKKIDRLSADQKKAVETLIDSFAADKKEE